MLTNWITQYTFNIIRNFYSIDNNYKRWGSVYRTHPRVQTITIRMKPNKKQETLANKMKILQWNAFLFSHPPSSLSVNIYPFVSLFPFQCTYGSVWLGFLPFSIQILNGGTFHPTNWQRNSSDDQLFDKVWVFEKGLQDYLLRL